MNKDYIEKCRRLLGKEEKINVYDYNLKDICTRDYTNMKLAVPIGVKKDFEPVFMNFTRVSGLFIGGTTGSGKSIFIDDLVVCLMLKNTSDEIKFIFFDPKKIELGEYDGINYILGKKSETNARKGKNLLLKILNELKRRIDVLISSNSKTITSYNKKVKDKWPHIFIVLDEGCDIFNQIDCQKILEEILFFGKVVGFHLIFATNSYLKDYAESKFIERFKYRMSFDLASKEQADYIDIKNSNWLNGRGEAYIKSLSGDVYRFQAPSIWDKQISNVVLEVGKKS